MKMKINQRVRIFPTERTDLSDRVPDPEVRQIWENSAKRWRESALRWRGIMREALCGLDFRLAMFASQEASQCEAWAFEDDERAVQCDVAALG